MSFDPNFIGSVVTAVGALGVAACALVDTSKTLPGGGVSNIGFDSVKAAVNLFLPTLVAEANAQGSAVAPGTLLDTLHANWINGMPVADQKSVAKSLIKLKLTPDSAAVYAAATQVDASALAAVAACMTTGTALVGAQTNTLGRFDLALTAILDAAYQRAEQRYRNACKTWAGVVAVVLAVLGGATVGDESFHEYLQSSRLWMSLFCGILAVPLAPITKDLTSALAAGVKVAQSIKR